MGKFAKCASLSNSTRNVRARKRSVWTERLVHLRAVHHTVNKVPSFLHRSRSHLVPAICIFNSPAQQAVPGEFIELFLKLSLWALWLND
jgi:hypothetical protein